MTAHVAATVVLSALACAATFAQSPRDSAPVRAAGRIAGTVVSIGVERKPLRRARVTLNGSSLQPGRTVITRDDGAFAFEALPPGQYGIAVTKNGYITTEYGSSGYGRPGVPVTVAPGGQQTIVIPVPRGSAITGTLTDANGQPLPGLQVRTLTYRITPPSGDRRLVPMPGGSVVTDDRGVYRIFGLPAGEYIVAVRPRPGVEAHAAGLRTVGADEIRQALAEVRRPRDRRLTPPAPPHSSAPPEPAERVAFAPVFYPGTTNVAHARMLKIGAGEERGSIDFQVDYVAVARITGTVVLSAGGADVSLARDPRESLIDEPGNRSTAAGSDGRFTFDHVPPGRYVLTVQASPTGFRQTRYDPAADLWASTEVIVDGQDITNIVLTPVPGLTIAGSLVFQGKRAPARPLGLHAMRLPLWSRAAYGAVAVLSPDGQFAISNMAPGLYHPDSMTGIRTPIGAWWLKSIMIDGREMLDAPLNIRTSTDKVTVTFADVASDLTGRVLDGRGGPVTNHMVLVFPTDSSAWFFNSRRIATSAVDAQGRYRIRNLPAGDYLIVARNDLDDLEWFNPDTLQQLVSLAARVRIADNEQLTYDITVPLR